MDLVGAGNVEMLEVASVLRTKGFVSDVVLLRVVVQLWVPMGILDQQDQGGFPLIAASKRD